MQQGGMKVKTLKKLLKKAGLKTSGKKTALTRRAKKAKLLKGGLFDMFRKPKPTESTDLTEFSASNPMFKPTNTPKQAKWEGSPEQIAARAERLESPTRADSIFVKAQRTPDYYPGLAESYLKKHGSKLFDQDPDLAKDYIQHNWLSPIKR